MWDMIDGIRRPARRPSRVTMIPAMLLGAGIGIATWEMVKRRGNGATTTADIIDKVSDAMDGRNS